MVGVLPSGGEPALFRRGRDLSTIILSQKRQTSIENGWCTSLGWRASSVHVWNPGSDENWQMPSLVVLMQVSYDTGELVLLAYNWYRR